MSGKFPLHQSPSESNANHPFGFTRKSEHYVKLLDLSMFLISACLKLTAANFMAAVQGSGKELMGNFNAGRNFLLLQYLAE